MKTVKSLVTLQENVSENTFNDILQIMEGLFVNDGRGDLLDDISKLLTGKTLKQHVQHGIKGLTKNVPKKTTAKFKKATK